MIGLLEGPDLLLEGAEDAAQTNAHAALSNSAVWGDRRLGLSVGRDGLEAIAEEEGHALGAGDVEVGEVGRVALVQVVVGLEDGVVRGRDGVVEEHPRRLGRGLQEGDVVPDDCRPDSVLCAGVSVDASSGWQTGDGLTVHTKGMFFQLVTTKSASRMRLVRPGPVTKLVAIVLRSMCSRDTPATPTAPTPSGRRKPSAFADAISTAILHPDAEFYVYA